MWEYAERYPLLNKINSPEDLKSLSKNDLTPLAEEIRSLLIDRVQENGGHLASNLGVVELSIALHRVFSTPFDHIIFDVGHQSYTHKILTGRKEVFSTIRQPGGISGFPKIDESEHDAFGTAHASTSFSAALGFAQADKLKESNACTVCVFGDGAYTGGMIHEALNNCKNDLRLILILNENEMSISKNIGKFAKQLSKIRSTKGYWKWKGRMEKIISAIPVLGKHILNRLRRYKKDVKGALYGSNVFEELGLSYFGPIDGNDEELLEKVLLEAKESNRSCIIHIKTKKGKGYLPAEKSPDLYHGMPQKNQVKCENTFSDIAGKTLTELAKKNDKICAVTAAMAQGTGLLPFSKTFPKRFFDVGIAEEHAVTFAAGLSANGMQPFVAIYSTFLQRSYDNILHDVGLQNLPVIFLVDRAGINENDGPTHSGVFDVSFLAQNPRMTIYAPMSFASLQNDIKKVSKAKNSVAIRYSNCGEDASVLKTFFENGSEGNTFVKTNFFSKDCLDVCLITYGRIAKEAIKVQNILQTAGKKCGIILLEQIAPFQDVAKNILPFLPQKSTLIVFLQEEIRSGGVGENLAFQLKNWLSVCSEDVLQVALENPFVASAKNRSALEMAGLDSQSIAQKIKKKFKEMEEQRNA